MTEIADDSALCSIRSLSLDVIAEDLQSFYLLSKLRRKLYERLIYEYARDNRLWAKKDDFYISHRGWVFRGVMAENFLSYAHSICHSTSYLR